MTAAERRSVASLALLYMLRMLGLFMVLPLLALYAAELPGASPFLLGIALGVYGLTQALLQIPLGWLSDRLGRKPVIVGGLLVFIVGSVVAALADSMTGIIIGRALQGAGAIASTVMALVADLTSEEQRTKAMAMVGISIGIAFALALVIGPAVAAIGGLSGVFWLTACLAIGGIAIVAFRVPRPPAPVAPDEHGARWQHVALALRDGALGRLNIGVFTLHFVLMAAFLVVPGLLEEVAAVDRADHWMVYLPALVLSILGMLPLMRWGERGGRPRLSFSIALGCVMVAIVLLVLAGSSTAVFVGVWLFFVGFNFLEATLPSMVSKVAPEVGRGSAMGVFSTCQFLGAFAGGAAGGWLLQYAGVWGLAMACLLLCTLWAVVALRPATDSSVAGDAPKSAEA